MKVSKILLRIAIGLLVGSIVGFGLTIVVVYV